MKNKVSVCVPVYNGANFIEECLDNIIKQSYSNLEILVIDDNSSDSSAAIIQELANQDKRIRFIKNDSSLGLVGNWNECLKQAKGNWIKFQFQDDLMRQNAISLMLDFCIKNETHLTISDREYLYSTSEKTTINFYKKLKRLNTYFKESRIVEPCEIVGIANRTLLQRNFLGEPIVGLFSKKIIKQYGSFNTNLFQLIDFEFWLRVTSSTTFGYINEQLNVFRVHDKSATAKEKSRSGFNRSSLDRLFIANAIVNDNRYEGYRKQSIKMGKPIEELMQDFTRKMILKNGTRQIKKHLGGLSMPPLSISDRMMGAYKDYLHRSWKV